jgi:uncharacterized phiE125 gp8 family phage protein
MRDVDWNPALVPVAAPTERPITVAEAKAQIRELQSTEDDYIDGLIKRATLKYEADIQWQLVTASRTLHMRRFPSVIVVPFPPLQAAKFSITYLDTDGVSQTLAATEYQLDVQSIPGEVVEAFDKSWPDTRDQKNAITVAYDCGYGDADSVPFLDKHAIALLVAHWFKEREPILTGTIQSALPQMYEDIVNQRRIERWDL